jgi:raffinose/stachyose/melibiose transport system permease protein
MNTKKKIGGTKRAVSDFFKVFSMVAVFLFYMVPFVLIILNSFKYKRDIIKNPFSFAAEKGFTFENYTVAFEKMNFIRSFSNSFMVTGLSTLIVILLSAMTAYYFVRAKNRFSGIFFSLMAASMIIPFQAIMIPLVSIYGAKLNMLNSRMTLVFFHIGFAMSMSVFIYQGFIKSSIPLSLEEAACIDGCSKLQTFFLIVFPLLKPITSCSCICSCRNRSSAGLLRGQSSHKGLFSRVSRVPKSCFFMQA